MTASGEQDMYGPGVAGVDEAGRGPWAGPVAAAAVILPQGATIEGLVDSKKLTERRREALYAEIMAHADVGLGLASVAEIDAVNILQATFLAMGRAIAKLRQVPGEILIDGDGTPPRLPARARAIVKGDEKVKAIAAASIIAKVARDRIMIDLARAHPYYAWESNKGYGAPAHRAGLEAHGICEHHRRSFAPIKLIAAQSRSSTQDVVG